MGNTLVVNRSTTRKQDLWMLSAEQFSDEEVKMMAGFMRKYRIRVLKPNTNCRWDKIYTKEEVLGMFQLYQDKKRKAKGK